MTKEEFLNLTTIFEMSDEDFEKVNSAYMELENMGKQDFCKLYTEDMPRVSVSAMLVSMRQKNIAQVSILERYFFVSTYQAAGPDTCLAVFVVASLPLCL